MWIKIGIFPRWRWDIIQLFSLLNLQPNFLPDAFLERKPIYTPVNMRDIREEMYSQCQSGLNSSFYEHIDTCELAINLLPPYDMKHHFYPQDDEVEKWLQLAKDALQFEISSYKKLKSINFYLNAFFKLSPNYDQYLKDLESELEKHQVIVQPATILYLGIELKKEVVLGQNLQQVLTDFLHKDWSVKDAQNALILLAYIHDCDSLGLLNVTSSLRDLAKQKILNHPKTPLKTLLELERIKYFSERGISL